jgi:hypothetical protein
MRTRNPTPQKRRAKKPTGRCQVCRHDERWRIELLRAGGASVDSLGQKFNLDRDAIWRHWTHHVSDETKASFLCGPVQLAELGAKAASEGDSVLDHLKMIRTVLSGQLAAMNEAGDGRGAAYVAGRLTSVLEAIGRVTGELGAMAQSINVTNNLTILAEHPAFLKVQATMLKALAAHPEARASVVAALRDLEAENAPASTPMKVIEHVK